MPWSICHLSDGADYEVRHTIDSGFKARRCGTNLWTDGNETVVEALGAAFEGILDSLAELEIERSAARMMEHGFTNIPSGHHGR
jgi:hypothetical protein